MDSNSDFNPTLSVSDIETNPFSDPILSKLEDTTDIGDSNLNKNTKLGLAIASSSTSISYNKDINSKIYIFKNGLFKQTILPTIEGNNEEIEVQCIM